MHLHALCFPLSALPRARSSQFHSPTAKVPKCQVIIIQSNTAIPFFSTNINTIIVDLVSLTIALKNWLHKHVHCHLQRFDVPFDTTYSSCCKVSTSSGSSTHTFQAGRRQSSAINTIQTLADRLVQADENQLSVEDRRAAVLALKGLSRDHNRAVGEHALPALLESIQRDAKDEDTARALIECCITLCEVQSPEAQASAAAAGANNSQVQQNRRKQQQDQAHRRAYCIPTSSCKSQDRCIAFCHCSRPTVLSTPASRRCNFLDRFFAIVHTGCRIMYL